MRLIIAGSRNVNISTDNILAVLDENGYHFSSLEIVSGGAVGPDTEAIKFAGIYNMPLHIYPAKWDTLGRSAGIIRNQVMGDFADELLAFWDGKSRGTKHMINYMVKLNKPARVIEIGNQTL